MSLFGFGDINFNKTSTPVNGPLSALEGTPFASSSFRYPADVGNYDKGHYMVFYVREQKNTAYPSTYGTASESSIDSYAASSTKAFENLALPVNVASEFGSGLVSGLNSTLSKINSATGGYLSGVTGSISSAATNVVGGINSLFGQAATTVGNAAATKAFLDTSIKKITNTSFIQNTRLTKEAIALYMPDTLMYTQQQNYTDVSLGSEVAGQLIGAAQTATATTGGIVKAAASLGAAAGLKLAERAGQSAVAVALGAAGYAQNPMLELVYSSPAFRTFQFDFVFYPRDEKEALQVQKIIDRFRFHQCPETTSFRNILVPPSQFDIRFYYGGRQNPNIPTIATCVLTGIDINYAPNGFSAYEIPGESSPSLGRTGMPVAVQMVLQFKEVTILTKDDFGRQKSSTSTPNFGESTTPVTGGNANIGPLSA